MKILLSASITVIMVSCGYPFEPYVEPECENDIEIVTDTTTNEMTITIEV